MKTIAWKLAALIMVSACGGATPPPAAPGGAAPAQAGDPSPEPAPAAAPRTFTEQVALGQTLYGESCAGCHGAAGEGGKGPRVVGLAAGALPLDPPAGANLRTEKFETVADVAAFVVRAMPPGKAGTLTEDEYFAILAFDLEANGIDLGDEKLDAALAPTLRIPRE